MPDVKISGLTAGGTVDVGELYEIEKTESGSEGSYKRTYSELHGITLYEDQNSSFIYAMPAKTILREIIFIIKSGTPTIKAGFTAGSDTVLYEETLSLTETTFPLNFYKTAATNIYLTISGGIVDVIFVNPKLKN